MKSTQNNLEEEFELLWHSRATYPLAGYEGDGKERMRSFIRSVEEKVRQEGYERGYKHGKRDGAKEERGRVVNTVREYLMLDEE